LAQDYLGVDRTFYNPTDRGWEGQMRDRIDAVRALLRSAKK
jgi:putative ATPase